MYNQKQGTKKPSRKPVTVPLYVRISRTVDRQFRKHIGDGRILAKAVEQALLNEVKRGAQA